MAYNNPGMAILDAQRACYTQSTQRIHSEHQKLNEIEWRISERARLISVITKAEVDGQSEINFASTPELEQLLKKVIGFAEPKIDFLGKGHSLKKEQFKHQIELIREASTQDQQKAQNLFLKINQVYQDLKDITDSIEKTGREYRDFISRILRKMAS